MRCKYTPHKWFIVLDNECNVFAGLKAGFPTWSSNIDEAKELYSVEAFYSLQRWESGRKLSLEYI